MSRFTNYFILGLLSFTFLIIYNFNPQEESIKPPLQTIPSTKETSSSPQATATAKTPQIDLSHLETLGPYQKNNLILNALPPLYRSRLAPHINYVFQYSKHYNIDPFWTIAIMWTESHFQIDAVSIVNAQGLMQVMPNTALYIGRLLKKKMDRKALLEYAKSPQGNIEFGTFYLSFLLNQFKGNHMLATVAYNMGPYWVSQRLKYGRPIGVDNKYLNKVNHFYKKATRTYKAWTLTLSDQSPLLAQKKKTHTK